MDVDDFTIAVVCSSNMNRSMEAHAFLSKKGFNVRSFGSRDKMKLPGIAPDKPNIYDFGCSYADIYKDLYRKDATFYTQNGLLSLLERNRRVKRYPEKFQLCSDQFTVVITCEERVYDQVLEHFKSILIWDKKPVHIINIDIEDNQEEATLGAFLIYELVYLMARSEDLDDNIDQLCVQYERKCNRPILHCVQYY